MAARTSRNNAGLCRLSPVAEKVLEIFKKEFPSNPFVVDSSYEIGPAIGQKLQHDALIAISISMLGIIIYVAARFEFRFGIAAAIAAQLPEIQRYLKVKAM